MNLPSVTSCLWRAWPWSSTRQSRRWWWRKECRDRLRVFYVSVVFSCIFITTSKVLLMKNILHLQCVNHHDSCNLICVVSNGSGFCPSTVVHYSETITAGQRLELLGASFRMISSEPAGQTLGQSVRRYNPKNKWQVKNWSTFWQVLSLAPSSSNDLSWQVGTACADIRGPEHGKRCEDVCFWLRNWLDCAFWSKQQL